MGKRKQVVPKKVGENERKDMTWDMAETVPSTSNGVTVIGDDHPDLLAEIENAEHDDIPVKQRKTDKNDVDYPSESLRVFEDGTLRTPMDLSIDIAEDPCYRKDDLLDIFDLHMQRCLFRFQVLTTARIKKASWSCELAKFDIKFSPAPLFVPLPVTGLPNTEQFMIHVCEEKCILSCATSDGKATTGRGSKKAVKQRTGKDRDVRFWIVETSLPQDCLEALQCRTLQIVLDSFHAEEMCVKLKIVGGEDILARLAHPSEAIRPKMLHESLKVLMQHFYGISAPDYEHLPHSKKHDIDQLFSVIRDRHLTGSEPILSNVQHPDLLPRLRPYQQQAISWMVHQEKRVQHHDADLEHLLYTDIQTLDGQTLYFNKYAGTLVLSHPHHHIAAPGGILGDEMGLGKTVEVVACMLHHPRDHVPQPDLLPVLEEDLTEVVVVKKKRKRRKRRRVSISSDSDDSDETVDYSDLLPQIMSTVDASQSTIGKVSCDSASQSITSGVSCDGASQSTTCGVSCDGTSQSITSGVSCDSASQSINSGVSCDGASQSTSGVSCDGTSQSTSGVSCDGTSQSTSGVSCDGTSQSTSGVSCDGTSQSIASQMSCDSASQSSTSGVSGDSASQSKATLLSCDSGLKLDGTSKDHAGHGESVERSVENKNETNNDNNINNSLSENENETEQHMKTKVKKERTPYKNIFTERPEVGKAEFECLCGASGLQARRKNRRLHSVQCTVCRLWQHAECVNYDLLDPHRGEFKCPHCHAAAEPIPSGATLIISPAAIAHQWVEEILKHVQTQALNVLMYEGVSKQRFIQPRTLAKQDIVITTYETLRKEIDYVDLPHSNSKDGRKLRHPKRFMAIPSPIIAVQWWRICLDEAQMVECTTTKTAEMALRLSAVNRWCVTGTPIQKGIDDLYGLLLFLGVDPYWVQMWWNRLVFEPYCRGVTAPMYDLLTAVLWRTVKLDVLDQIDIPEQSEEIHWLNFSPVEEHFYRRQYKDCVRLSMQTLRKWTDSTVKLCNLDRGTVSKMLNPLVRLRQACCHPQVVRGEFLPLKKDTMTMDQLLESLTKKAKVEAEESHRALVASMNGQAGLHIIQEQFVEAVELYREVLRSVEEHKHMLKTDGLQQLHAMYNLNEILSSKPAGVDPTLRDDLLAKQIEELKEQYLAKAVAYLKSTEEALAPTQVEVKLMQREVSDGELWYLDVIQWTKERDLEDTLLWKLEDDVHKDKSHFDRNNRERPRTFLERHLNNTRALQYAMHKQTSDMKEAYKELQKAMAGLHGDPTQDLINVTVECCLRPVAEVLNTCPFCKTKELFESYESKLFSFIEKDVLRLGPEGTSGYKVNREGTWADSDLEKALKSILTFAKSYRVSDDLIDYGTSHLKLFDALKREYKKLRAHWAGKKEHVASFDELDMSTTRLRLRLPDEPVPDTPQLNILDTTELPQHEMKLASDRIIANGELRKKLGQLLYLTNLAKNQINTEDGSNPDPCPICQQELGKNWSVMQCGHCFCMDCVRILQERSSFGRQHFTIKCAICRQPSHQSEISYVVTTQKISEEDVKVKGSHSTKVEAVVRCLLEIQRQDPTAKSLVFSTWTDVLSVIARALTENDLNYKALYTAGKFQESLSTFKQQEDETILLLPVHSGANGLNLIEATHVLLVEPILNPAQELQAIGRVHRIGQTLRTTVHRFLIQNTIEQKMYTLLKTMEVSPSVLKGSNEMSLTIGDLTSLFTQQLEAIDREGVHSPEVQESDDTGPNLLQGPGPSLQHGTTLTLQGTASNLQQGADPNLQQGADPNLQQGADPNLQQGADPNLQQGTTPNLQQRNYCNLQQGTDPNLQQGTDPNLQQGTDPNLQQGTDPNLQHGPAINLQQGATSNLHQGAAPNVQQRVAPNLHQESYPT